MEYDYNNELTESELYSSEQGPLSPETGDPMLNITENFEDIPDGIEVWECLDTRAIYIRTHVQGNFGKVDYTATELNEIKEIARTIIN